MANPSYFQAVPPGQQIQHKEFLFHLYMYQRLESQPDGNQKLAVSSSPYGSIVANDWTMYDGLGPKAKLVARAQGMHVSCNSSVADSWLLCFGIVFTDERLKGSSLKVIGSYESNEGEWAIVGGTGQFAFAQGVATFKKKQELEGANIREIHIRVFCLTFPDSSNLVTKIGPWGGNGGTTFDIKEKPQLLESVTIRSNDVIESLAFSYIDNAGQKQTAGPWGGHGGATSTIQMAPGEIVKEVSGTTGGVEGSSVVASLTLITNVGTYGPYGKARETPFSVPVQDNSSVVGFFARAGTYIDALGVYVRPSLTNM